MKIDLVYLEIESWTGLCHDAIHCYGNLIGNISEDVNKEDTSIRLQRTITEKEAILENKKRRSRCSLRTKVGDKTDGFVEEKDLIKFAIRNWKKYFPNASILIKGRPVIAEPQTILVGPSKLKSEVNKLVKAADKLGRYEKEENDKEMDIISDKWIKLMKEVNG